MKEKLINFLKKNRVYKKYMTNIGDDTIEAIIERAEFANKPKIVNPIVTAFVWHLTPEGLSFWARISRKWNETIKD